MTGYELSKNWFSWAFENQGKVNPANTALYFFVIEYANRMGWVERFGLPTDLAKATIGVNHYKTYINALNQLIDFGFIIMYQKSKNQYTANIIGLAINAKAHAKASTKAFDKASINHVPEKSQDKVKSKDTIDKPITNENQETVKTTKTPLELKFDEFKKFRKAKKKPILPESELALKNRIWKLSNNNKENAIKIIDQSIANGWTGVFELKEENIKTKTGKSFSPSPRVQTETKEPSPEERMNTVRKLVEGLYSNKGYVDFGSSLYNRAANAGLVDNKNHGEAKSYMITMWERLIKIKPEASEFEAVEKKRFFEFWYLEKIRSMFTKEELFTKLIEGL